MRRLGWIGLFLSATTLWALDVEVQVTGDGGAPVPDIPAAEFSVRDGGQKEVQKVVYVDDVSALKLYIAVQTQANDFPRLVQALEAFLAEGMPDGMEVSLGGTPFTSDRDKLREYLATGLSLDESTPSGGFVRLWDVGAQFDVQGAAALAPYIQLCSQLAAVPGRKAVALFRPALRLDREGLDVRATTRIPQSRENLDSDIANVQGALDRLETAALFSRTRIYPSSTGQGASMNMPGLNRIASATGGRPMLGTGDPGAVFDLILEDARGYYVVSYDPELKGNDAKRSIKVDVERKGVRVRGPDSYLDLEGLGVVAESRPSPLDLDPAGADLPIEVSHAFFRGPEGKPVLIWTAGVDAAQLEGEQDGKRVAVSLTAAGGAADGEGGWTGRGERSSRQVFDSKAFESAKKKGGAPVEIALQTSPVGPGPAKLRLTLRDDTSTRYGVEEAELFVPDFSRPLATSTLVVSRRAVETKKAEETPEWGAVLDYAGTRVMPEATREFRVGDTILFSYRLYNTPPEMLQSAPPPQIALMRGEMQLDSFDLQAESRVDGETVQYMGAIKTNGLEPGDYILLSAVPGREDERQPYVETQFRLVKK